MYVTIYKQSPQSRTMHNTFDIHKIAASFYIFYQSDRTFTHFILLWRLLVIFFHCVYFIFHQSNKYMTGSWCSDNLLVLLVILQQSTHYYYNFFFNFVCNYLYDLSTLPNILFSIRTKYNSNVIFF